MAAVIPSLRRMVMPPTALRWRKMKMSRTGTAKSEDAAMVAPQSLPKADMNSVSHSGRVCALLSLLRIRTMANSFQAVMKPKSEVDIRPGASRGKITLRKAWPRVQPSIWAASSRVTGTAAMKPRRVQMVKGRIITK